MNYYVCCLLIFLFLFFGIKFDDTVDCKVFDFFNRRIYAFNRGVDKIVLDPSVSVYINLTPVIVENSVNNFFKNISEIQNLTFFFLLKDTDGMLNSFSRFVINTTFGFLGFFDLASRVDLFYRYVDLKNLFNKYGYIESTYIMLPFIGPGTIKNNFSLLVAQILNPCFYVLNNFVFYCFFEIVRKKSLIVFDGEFFHKSMFDGYSFLKDIYMQNNFYSGGFESDLFLDEPPD